MTRLGLLAEHAGRFRFERADALAPGFGLDPGAVAGGKRFHAIFLNYVLDCLPATVLQVKHGQLKELHVRTVLARGVDLSAHTPLTRAEVMACGRSADPGERKRLRELLPLFALEHDYRPVDRDRIPFADTARSVAGPDEGVVLHNHGALACLEEALAWLSPQGFVLISDYADSPFDEVVQSYRHQQFDGSTAFGLNLALLRAQFAARNDCQWQEAPAGRRKLVTALLARAATPATWRAFRQQLGPALQERLYEPVEAARELVKAGRPEAALAAFRRALRRQPWNWALLAEVAEFLLFTVRDHPAAKALAEAGLAVNPASPELWNTLGDAQYYLAETEAAHRSFMRALDVHPANVRARYNLSFTFARRHDTSAALRVIAEALALDRHDRYRDRLVRRQAEILDQRARAREIEGRCRTDRWLPGEDAAGDNDQTADHSPCL
jgi:tetratricopeptide (TPR) repeat protein